MTIDHDNFEMTLEVLGCGEDAVAFFKTYDAETKKDLVLIRQCIDQRDWNSLKRACHTWKGRASQIGFCKSSFIAASLLDFIQNTVASSPRDSEVTDWLMSTSPHAEMVLRQVEIFWESLNKECLVISSFLKSQCLL